MSEQELVAKIATLEDRVGKLETIGDGAPCLQTTYALLPTPGRLSRVVHISNGFYLVRDDGTAFQGYGPMFRLPGHNWASGPTTWVNQGGATYSIAKGGCFLNVPANDNNGLHCLVKAAPGTPYVITVALLPLVGTIISAAVGLVWRDSVGLKLQTFCLQTNNRVYYAATVDNWTNPTTFSTNPYFQAWPEHPLWLRIGDTGVNRTCGLSADGQNFTTLFTFARNTYLTPNQVGVFACVRSAAAPAAAGTFLSWLEA